MSKKKKEVAVEHVRIYKSTHKRLARMAISNECSMAEMVDRLSKVGVAKTEVAATPVIIGSLKQLERNLSLKITEAQKPAEYFKNRTGLYIWSGFTERVLPATKLVKKNTAFKLNSFELTKNSTDAEIENSLPKNHLFSESDVCAIVAELISKQPKGENGILQNNGYANLFYLKSCVVYVYWYDSEWLVGAWYRDGITWDGDLRVFSPATVA